MDLVAQISPGTLLAERFEVRQAFAHARSIASFMGYDRKHERLAIGKLIDTEAAGIPRAQLNAVLNSFGAINSSRVQSEFELESHNNSPFVLRPYIEGRALSEIMGTPNSLEDCLALVGDLLEALKEIHGAGLQHRNLKPSNLLIASANPSRLMVHDPWLLPSVMIDSSSDDSVLEALRYMAPEAAGLIDHETGPHSDLYSVGCIFHSLLLGTPLFAGTTTGELLRLHLNLRVPPVGKLRTEIPRAIDEVLKRLLSKESYNRYQTAEAVLTDLVQIKQQLDAGEEEPEIVVGRSDSRRDLSEPAFIGRGRELEALKRAYGSTVLGQGGTFVVEGASGSGKSRLIHEFATSCLEGGTLFLEGQVVDQTANKPLQMLKGMVASLIQKMQRGNVVRDSLEELLAEDRDSIRSVFPEFRDVLAPSEEAPPLMTPVESTRFGETQVIRTVARLFDALGKLPFSVVIALDDFHWCDDLSRKCIQNWVAQQTRSPDPSSRELHLLLILSARSGVIDPEFLASLGSIGHLVLGGFTHREIYLMLESMAGPVPSEAFDTVASMADGNPFFARAVLEGLVETGAMVSSDGAWSVNLQELRRVQSSQKAASLLARRLDLLSDEVIRVLSVGAVIGKRFGSEMIASMAGQNPIEVNKLLHHAKKRHLLWQDAEAFVFVHDKVREALLRRLSEPTRQKIHQHVAETLIQQDDTRVFDIAYHLDASGDYEGALPFALKAKDSALSRFALDLARIQYEIAERGAMNRSGSLRRQVAEGLGDVLMLMGEYESAREKLQAALDLSDGNIERAKIDAKMGELAFKRGDMEEASCAITRGLTALNYAPATSMLGCYVFGLKEIAVQVLHSIFPRYLVGRRRLDDSSETELLAARLYGRLTYAWWFQRGAVPTLYAHLRELNLAERYPATRELGQAYSTHAPVMAMLPWCGRAIAYGRLGLDIRTKLGTLWDRAQALHFHGIALMTAAKLESALETFEQAVRLLERTGDRWELNVANYNLAFCHYLLGNLQKASELSEQIHRAGLQIGDGFASGASLNCWAKASGGRVPVEFIDAELERESRDQQRNAEVLQAKGLQLLGNGCYPEAVDYLNKAFSLVKQFGLSTEYVASIPNWLTTALRLQLSSLPAWDQRNREDLLRSALEMSRVAMRKARRYKNNLAHAHRERGYLLMLKGREDEARKEFVASRQWAKKLRMQHEHTVTSMGIGEIGRAVGWDEPESSGSTISPTLDLELSIGGSRMEPTRASIALVERFGNLLEVGRNLASSLSTTEVFGNVEDAALRLLRGQRCALYEVFSEEGDLEVVYVHGTEDLGLSPIGTRKVLEHRAPLTEADLDLAKALSEHQNVKSLILIPITVRGQISYIACVAHGQVAGLFSEDELKLGEFISSLAGAALENARGFERIKRLSMSLRKDILKRREVERELQTSLAKLQDSEGRFRRLVDSMADALFVHDNDGIIRDVNKRAVEALGYDRSDFIGRSLFELTQGLSTEASRKLWDRALDGQVSTVECEHVCHDGSRLPVEMSVSFFQASEPPSLVTLSRDVSRRRQAEDEKKRMQSQLVQASKLASLGTLGTGIAHELNNPLTNVKGFAQLIEREDEVGGNIKGWSQKIISAADRMRKIVDHLRTFARQSSSADWKPTNVATAVERALELTKKQLEVRGVGVEVSIGADLPPVKGDEVQLESVFQNLLINSRDAFDDLEDERERLVKISVATDSEGQVRVEYSDNAGGMADEVREKLFDPFFTTKKVGVGTGLGMSIIHGIIQAHRGTIEVLSELGGGTTFVVRFPATKKQRSSTSSETVSPIQGRAQTLPRVLLVDDEPDILELMKQSLGRQFEVICFSDPRQAIAALRSETFDIVITDLKMPGASGFDVLVACRKALPSAKIIMVSGHGDEDAVEKALLNGAVGFLQKPFPGPDDLLVAIDRLVTEKKAS